MYSKFTLLLALAVLPVAAQDLNKFRISTGDGSVKGTQEYRIEKTAEGYRVISTTHLETPAQPIELKEEQTLTPEWRLIKYRLEGSVASERQLVEASLEDNKVQMHLSAGQDNRTSSTLAHPRMVVLDKLMSSQVQILLNRLGEKSQPVEEWLVLRPHELTAAAGKLTTGATKQEKLNGQPLLVQYYTLESGPVTIDFCASKDAHTLMGVWVREPKIALTREGFAAEGRD